MGYVKGNLLPNEKITYQGRLHWIIYVLAALVFVIAILVALSGGGWIAGTALRGDSIFTLPAAVDS